MTPLQLLAAAAVLVGSIAPMPMAALAQPAVPGSKPAAGSTPPAAKSSATPSGTMSTAELEEILGPIALYPDELLANVLAACVYPDEVKEAASFVKSGGDKNAIDSRNWEDPVKAIAKIPDVAKMMGEYPDWVTAMGQAYLTQAQDVMATVQSLRKKASANGALKSTDQQKVQEKDGNVYIVSSDPQVIYVPSYSPSVVYVSDSHYDSGDVLAAGLIGFGTGIAVGAIWAGCACDWNHGCLGWGHSNVDVNINNNFNRNTNINNIGNGNRVGREGGAWSPNQSKSLATSRPSQAGNFGAAGAGGAARSSLPASSSLARPPAAPARRAGAATPSRVSAPAGGGSRMPSSMPSAERANRAESAFRGGSDTRAASNRGSASRESAGRGIGSGGGARSAPARSGGGSRGGGMRGGGGGGRRR